MEFSSEHFYHFLTCPNSLQLLVRARAFTLQNSNSPSLLELLLTTLFRKLWVN